MNRSFILPVFCAVLAFVALSVAFRGAIGRESVYNIPQSAINESRTSTIPNAAAPIDLLTVADAEKILGTLADEFTRPWRKVQSAPRLIYSRAAPRPIPTIESKIELAKGGDARDMLVLATITIHNGEHPDAFPCVIDRSTKQVRLYAAGQWQTQSEWLATAPSPFGIR